MRIVAIALVMQLVACATESTPSRSSHMQEFAFVFRTNRSLTSEQLAQRGAAVQAWALQQRKEGTLLTPHLFHDNGLVITQDSITPLVAEGAVAGVTTYQVKDMEAAVALAKTFPGLAFGTTVEVRPIKALPIPPPSKE